MLGGWGLGPLGYIGYYGMRSTAGQYTSYWNAFLLPPTNKVWSKVIFSEACVKNSVHGGEYLGRYPLGRYTPRQVHPPVTRYTPRAVHAGRYGQQAGGTHPTGMHSYLTRFLPKTLAPC